MNDKQLQELAEQIKAIKARAEEKKEKELSPLGNASSLDLKHDQESGPRKGNNKQGGKKPVSSTVARKE
jgi:hypothetical protein